MNWGLTPSGKLARYANSGEGSSSGGSCRPPLPPLPPRPDSSNDEDDAPALPLTSGNYAEEATVIELVTLVVA
jgi:hypothetical protein